MAKQTINIGASPNDGTGTPLRTAFDYTNQNFTELYTALGGGSGLPGASSQVIFNDGGTNLAGDSGLTFNKTTDLLTAGLLRTLGDTRVAEVGIFYVGQGLTPELKVDTSTGITSINGSATITGDLTVRTDKLAVRSNGVGIGTTSPTSYSGYTTLALVGGANGGVIDINTSGGVTAGGMQIASTAASTIFDVSGPSGGAAATLFFRTGAYGALGERYRIDGIGVSTWSISGSTAMTLNSTGLGVGENPITKFYIRDADLTGSGQIREQVIRAASNLSNNSLNSLVGFTFSTSALGYTAGTLVRSSGVYGINLDNSAFGRQMGLSFYTCTQDAAATEKMRIDSSGNVGIGVTPSAWFASRRVLSIGTASSISGYLSSSGTEIWTNVYLNTAGNGIYVLNNFEATRYYSAAGEFVWETAPNSGPSGAGTVATLTQKMKLDVFGNLILQSSSTPATLTTNGQLTVNATSNTNLRFSYRGSDGVTRVANITLA